MAIVLKNSDALDINVTTIKNVPDILGASREVPEAADPFHQVDRDDHSIYDDAPTEILPDFFVDATNGDDGQDGTSVDNAWKTISKVNGEAYSAGDIIAFKSGETWREQLILPSSGSSGSPITVTSYGSGAKPIITGADLATSWSSGGNEIVDSQLDTDFDFVNLSNNSTQTAWSQGYTPGETYDVTQVVLSLWKVGTPTDDLHVEIRADSSGVPGSVITNGTSATVATSGLGTSSPGADQTFTFATAPTLTASTLYHITLHTDGAVDSDNYVKIASTDLSNVVGDTLRFNSPTWGNEFDGDLYFKIYKAATTTWTKTISTDPQVVVFDGTYGIRVASAENVDAAFKWHWVANTLTVYSVGDPDSTYTAPGVEYGVRNRCMRMNGQDWIDITGIEFRISRAYCIFADAATTNCNFTNVTMFGGFSFNFVTQAAATQTDYLFENCSSSYSGAYGWLVGNLTARFSLRNCISNYDSILHSDFDDGSTENDFGSGIKFVNGTSLAGSGGEGLSDNHLVDGCTVTYAGILVDGRTDNNKGFGIWFDGVWPSTGDSDEGSTINNNICTNNHKSGLFCEKSRLTTWTSNISNSNAEHGLRMDGDAGPPDANQIPVRDNTFDGNTLLSNTDNGIYAAGGYNDVDNYVFDNTFSDNTTGSSGDAELFVHDGADNTGTGNTGNTYNNNNFGAESTGFINWDSTAYDTYTAWESASGQSGNGPD